MRCPTCNKEFEAASSKARPFCSERCRLSDLGKWLNEEYRIPGDPVEVSEADYAEEQRRRDGDEDLDA